MSSSKRHHPILGTKITQDDEFIPVNRLPTHQQVLRSFLCYTEGVFHQQNKCKRNGAKEVMSQIVNIYRRANIPTVSHTRIIQKVLSYHDKTYKYVQKINVLNRDIEPGKSKISQFKKELHSTMIFWPSHVEAGLQEEDRLFLESMKTDRVATMGSLDKNFAKKEKHRLKRHLKTEQQKILEVDRKNNADQSMISWDDALELDPSLLDEEADSSFTDPDKPNPHRRSIKSGTTIFISHDILRNPNLVSSLVRNNITPTAAAATIRCLIDACKGDSSKVNLSHSSAARYQDHALHEKAIQIRNDWQAPEVLSIHWDSKIMQSLATKHEKDDRLPVLVSGSDGVKLLGAPKLPIKSGIPTGTLVANAIEKLLQTWSCLSGKLSSMVFDTTASNTGRKTAACISLQLKIGHPLLWMACRHHVGEVVLSHVWKALKIEESSGPDVSVFKRFQSNFIKLKTTAKDIHTFISPIKPESQFVQQLQETLTQSFVRDDYREFVELCLIYATGSSEGIENFSFKYPGALHNARWMSKVLYSLKMTLLQQKICSDLPPDAVFNGKTQMENLKKFSSFIVSVYAKWWLTSSMPTKAPLSDLKFIQNLFSYGKTDPVASQAGLKAMKNHLWYLTEELVPLALFDEDLSISERQILADKIYSQEKTNELKNRVGTGFGRPSFPIIESAPTSLSLADFVGADSWVFFSLLKIDTALFDHAVSSWADEPSFQAELFKVKTLKVVNDVAERAVKLSTDFLSTSQNEIKYQNVLQVVEQERKSTPNQRSNRKI